MSILCYSIYVCIILCVCVCVGDNLHIPRVLYYNNILVLDE